jgi:hypothetical protein
MGFEFGSFRRRRFDLRSMEKYKLPIEKENNFVEDFKEAFR